MAHVVRAATLGHTIGISLIGTVKNVSITNEHNYLLIFGGFLNCGYCLCLYKMCEKNYLFSLGFLAITGRDMSMDTSHSV